MQVIRTPLYGLKPMLLLSMIADNHTYMGHVSPLVMDIADVNASRGVRVLVDKMITVTRECIYDPNKAAEFITATNYTSGHQNEMPGFAINDVFMDEFGRVCIALHGDSDHLEILDKPTIEAPRAADFMHAVEHLTDHFNERFKVHMTKQYVLDKSNLKFPLKVKYPELFAYEASITKYEYKDMRNVLRAFFFNHETPPSKFTTPEHNPIVIESERVKQKDLHEKMAKLVGIMNDEYDRLLKMADEYEMRVIERFSK